MSNSKAYSAASATAPLTPDTIKRRAVTDQDVQIKILLLRHLPFRPPHRA